MPPAESPANSPSFPLLAEHGAGMLAAHRTLDEVLARADRDGRLDPAGPSRLPGWSVGHVLAHIARNADSVTRALLGANAGRVDARYPGGLTQRDGDIEAGAHRSAAALLGDIRQSNAALEQAMGDMTTAGWSGACLAMGRAQPILELPLNRWREAEVHLSDVGLSSFTIDQWSDDFVRHDLAFALAQRDAELPEPIARRSSERQLAWIHGRYGPNDAAWDASTLRSGWRRPLTSDEVAAIEAAAIDPEIRPAPRPVVLPALERLVDELRQHLVEGQGVAAFEGFPVERFDPTQLRAIWWGVSCALGTPVSQSWRGDLIGDVRDLGTGISGPAGRGYTSNSELNFHADACDISGLFFLRTAKAGGVTRVASAVAAHDVMARRRPDALDLLYQPLPWSWQGNQPAGEPGWYEMPVFGLVDDTVSCAYVRTNILLAPQNAGAPSLSTEQIEAVQMLVETAAEPGMWAEHSFEPGAMVFVHNHTALHVRSAFTDWDEPTRKRHLLRVWVSTPNSHQLPKSFRSFFSSLDAGTVRGGYAPNPSAAAKAANTDTATRVSTS